MAAPWRNVSVFDSAGIFPSKRRMNAGASGSGVAVEAAASVSGRSMPSKASWASATNLLRSSSRESRSGPGGTCSGSIFATTA